MKDAKVWAYIHERKDFVRFTEIKSTLGLSPERLTRALRRLERDGAIFRTVDYYKGRPVNTYLAIDPKDEMFRARIVDDHGWIFVVLEWLDKDERPSRSISIQMGELADYVKFRNDESVVEWPPWAKGLSEAGKLTYEEFSWAQFENSTRRKTF